MPSMEAMPTSSLSGLFHLLLDGGRSSEPRSQSRRKGSSNQEESFWQHGEVLPINRFQGTMQWEPWTLLLGSCQRGWGASAQACRGTSGQGPHVLVTDHLPAGSSCGTGGAFLGVSAPLLPHPRFLGLHSFPGLCLWRRRVGFKGSAAI